MIKYFLTDSFFVTPLEQFDSELRILEQQHTAKNILSNIDMNIRFEYLIIEY